MDFLQLGTLSTLINVAKLAAARCNAVIGDDIYDVAVVHMYDDMLVELGERIFVPEYDEDADKLHYVNDMICHSVYMRECDSVEEMICKIADLIVEYLIVELARFDEDAAKALASMAIEAMQAFTSTLMSR